MSTYNISTRYALALLELAEEKQISEIVSSDVDLILNTLQQSRDLRLILKSPIIKDQKKIDILDELFKNKISIDTNNFLKFIVDKKREELLLDIMLRYSELNDEKLGRVKVEVFSADELEQNQKDVIKTKLIEFTNKKVTVKYNTDNTLIGGFIAKVGDSVIDASVQQQLSKLKKHLLA
jgi:F-type H+-transporting ATPase subunit delta